MTQHTITYDDAEWQVVPKEPTMRMIVDGSGSAPDECFSPLDEWDRYSQMTGCEQAAYRTRKCWEAMLAAAPQPEAVSRRVPSDEEIRALAREAYGDTLGPLDLSFGRALLSRYGQPAATIIPAEIQDIMHSGTTVVLFMESVEAARSAYNAIEGAHRVAVNIGQPAASAEPVGEVVRAGPMYAPGTTMAVFKAGEVPVGTKLHAAPVAAQDPTIKESSIVAQARPVPLELDGVAEAIKDGGGTWRTCTGCHELNEGHDTGPYSETLKCHLGNGCSECGGIGAIWDTTDYGAMADAMMNGTAQVQPVALPDVRDYSDLRLRNGLSKPVVSQPVERAAFESWHQSEMWEPGYAPGTYHGDAYNTTDDGYYRHPETQLTWRGWQARAALAQQPSAQDREDAAVLTSEFSKGYELGLRQRTSQDRDDAERWRQLDTLASDPEFVLDVNAGGWAALKVMIDAARVEKEE